VVELIVFKSGLRRGPLVVCLALGVSSLLILLAILKGSLTVNRHLDLMELSILSLLVVGGFGGFVLIWYHDSKTSRVLERLSSLLRVEGDKLVIERPILARRGVITIRADEGGEHGRRFQLFFRNVEREAEYIQELEPVADVSSVDIVANVSGIKISAPKWVKIPGYEIVEPELTVKGIQIVLGVIPPLKHEVTLFRNRLEVSKKEEWGAAELKVIDGRIEGTLTYSRSASGKSKELRLELVFDHGMTRYGAMLARMKVPGEVRFSWKPALDNVIYILASSLSPISPRRVMEKAGIKGPVVMGDAWSKIRSAKLRLVLDMPFASDVIDETEIAIKSSS